MKQWLITTAFALACTLAQPCVSASSEDTVIVESFDATSLPENMETRDARVRLVEDKQDGGRTLEVRFMPSERPGFTISPQDGEWNWTAFGGVAVEIENPEQEPVEVFVQVQGVTDTGERRVARCSLTIAPGEKRAVPVFLRNHGLGPYWGMRGIPVRGPVLMKGPGMTETPDGPALISKLSVHLRRCPKERTLLVDEIRVFEAGSPLDRLVPFPFVDKFGQYIHDDWPGKVRDEADLRVQGEKEDAALRAAPELAGRDRFGGWADGPKLEATGWFRAQKVDGKWWLVTPEGYLFFSLGVNCVRRGDSTFVERRDGWFEQLPGPESEFKGLVDSRKANFYAMNLRRKFGDEYAESFRSLAHRRLKAWGFNTVGNWSGSDVLKNSPMPFVVTLHAGRRRMVEASSGYWGKLVDPFDPTFGEDTRNNLRAGTAPFAENPQILGYFVDNEMSWTRIAESTLASPADQPARVVFTDDLKAKYGSIDRVNDAWETAATSWDGLRVPRRAGETCRADSEAFEYKFARRYFDTVKNALREYAPNQLYMGCRFTPIYCPEPVLKACADVADVVSMNLYYRKIAPDMLPDIDKPVIIGEFHFGALDRGMFHQGLQAAADQDERGTMYVDYVKSVAEHPLFVGCHWFQYFDQPITGRTGDGENYSIGLVSVVDVPYEELLKAAKRVHLEVYAHRYIHN
jgi:hypothetical protein